MALCSASPPSPRGSPGPGDGGSDEALSEHLSIIVLGASGDLAVKKTYPALFALYRHGLLPGAFTIVGYARSKMEHSEFLKKISAKFGEQGKDKRDEFLKHCWYVSGQYDSQADFKSLHSQLKEKEQKGGCKKGAKCNRLFYLALPPTAFVPAARSIKSCATSSSGWTRVVVSFSARSHASCPLAREAPPHVALASVSLLCFFLLIRSKSPSVTTQRAPHSSVAISVSCFPNRRSIESITIWQRRWCRI